MPRNPPKYRLPVFVADDAIMFYAQDGELRYTHDLSVKCEPLFYLSVTDSFPLSQEQEAKIIKSIRNIMLPELGVTKITAEPEKIFRKVKKLSDAKWHSHPFIFRDGFNYLYDQLPQYLRAIAATRTEYDGYGPQVLISDRYKELSSIFHGEKVTDTVAACCYLNNLYFKEPSCKSDTILEEVTHLVDRRVRIFSRDTAWAQAVLADLQSPAPVTDLVTAISRVTKSDKSNTAKSLLQLGNAREATIEALPDIMMLESRLISIINDTGNLAVLGAGVTKSDTIDDVMNRTLPNMWKMYRGPGEGKKLIQDEKGQVLEINASEDFRAGCYNVKSWRETCEQKLRDLGLDIKVDLPELPTPHEKKPVSHQEIQARRSSSWPFSR